MAHREGAIATHSMPLKCHSTVGHLRRSQHSGEKMAREAAARVSAAPVHVLRESPFVLVTQGKQRHQNFAVGLNRGCGTLYAYSVAGAMGAPQGDCAAIRKNN
jgi:hypothetical protein